MKWHFLEDICNFCLAKEITPLFVESLIQSQIISLTSNMGQSKSRPLKVNVGSQTSGLHYAVSNNISVQYHPDTKLKDTTRVIAFSQKERCVTNFFVWQEEYKPNFAERGNVFLDRNFEIKARI